MKLPSLAALVLALTGLSAGTLLADDDPSPGQIVYLSSCASCHQVDGTGTPTMQPGFVNNPIVTGDSALLINIVLKGPANVLPADRPHFTNTMDAFSYKLEDQQIADVLTYIRKEFGKGAAPIDVKEDAAARAKMDADDKAKK